ncbi:hypothetical protein OS145_05500, partial [Idiomarina baltica OS145]
SAFQRHSIARRFQAIGKLVHEEAVHVIQQQFYT